LITPISTKAKITFNTDWQKTILKGFLVSIFLLIDTKRFFSEKKAYLPSHM
jgi:hypothetical protein